MPVTYRWDDPETRSILRYVMEGVWNWKEYHHVAQVASFALSRSESPVDVIIDMTASARLPGGALAHVRTFGKRSSPKFSGRAIVIGLPADVRDAMLAGSPVPRLAVGDQQIWFVDTDEDAQSLLARLASEEV